MTPITQEWVDKAEADFATAGRELLVQNQPNNDAICFHAQQCVEKYLKARLVEARLSPPRTHDLEELLDLNLAHEPLWDAFRQTLIDLSSYAVKSDGQNRIRELHRDSKSGPHQFGIVKAGKGVYSA